MLFYLPDQKVSLLVFFTPGSKQAAWLCILFLQYDTTDANA